MAKRLVLIGPSKSAVDLPTMPAARALSDEEADDHAPLLQVTAEATRNPAVAETVRLAERRLHDKAVEATLADPPGIAEAEASARVEMLAVLAEGTACRRTTVHPADTGRPTDVYVSVIAHLLQPVERKALAGQRHQGAASGCVAKKGGTPLPYGSAGSAAHAAPCVATA